MSQICNFVSHSKDTGETYFDHGFFFLRSNWKSIDENNNNHVLMNIYQKDIFSLIKHDYLEVWIYL